MRYSKEVVKKAARAVKGSALRDVDEGTYTVNDVPEPSPSAAMITAQFTEEELQTLMEALQSHPRPEWYDFGPAYALERKRAKALRNRLWHLLQPPEPPPRLPPIDLSTKEQP